MSFIKRLSVVCTWGLISLAYLVSGYLLWSLGGRSLESSEAWPAFLPASIQGAVLLLMGVAIYYAIITEGENDLYDPPRQPIPPRKTRIIAFASAWWPLLLVGGLMYLVVRLLFVIISETTLYLFGKPSRLE